MLALGHRAEALRPHAVAGNGVPDQAFTALPAYEPRLGHATDGVPQATAADAATLHPAAPAADGAVPQAGSTAASHPELDALSQQAVAALGNSGPASGTPFVPGIPAGLLAAPATPS